MALRFSTRNPDADRRIAQYVQTLKNLIGEEYRDAGVPYNIVDEIGIALVEVFNYGYTLGQDGGGLRKEAKRPSPRKAKPEPEIGHRVASYLETILWAENDQSDPETGGEPLDNNYSIYDFAPEAVAEAEAELDKFYETNEDLLSQLSEAAMERVPFLFWLSRNGHGSGFFDEDYIDSKELRDALQEAAHKFGERYVEVGDDGKLYFL